MVDCSVFTIRLGGEDPLFKGWEAEAMRFIWASKTPVGSAQVTEAVQLRHSISRAAVIMFLQRMEKAGILGQSDRTGKGGHANYYHATVTRKELHNRLQEACIMALEEADAPRSTASGG